MTAAISRQHNNGIFFWQDINSTRSRNMLFRVCRSKFSTPFVKIAILALILIGLSSALIGGKSIQNKSFTRFSLQSGCCNFNQWEKLNLKQVMWFLREPIMKSSNWKPPFWRPIAEYGFGPKNGERLFFIKKLIGFSNCHPNWFRSSFCSEKS